MKTSLKARLGLESRGSNNSNQRRPNSEREEMSPTQHPRVPKNLTTTVMCRVGHTVSKNSLLDNAPTEIPMSECDRQSLPIKSWMWVIVAHLEGAFGNHDREWSWLTFFVIVIWNSRSFPITCFVNMLTYILIKNSKKGAEPLKILHNKMVKNRGQTFQNSSQQNGKKRG